MTDNVRIDLDSILDKTIKDSDNTTLIIDPAKLAEQILSAPGVDRVGIYTAIELGILDEVLTEEYEAYGLNKCDAYILLDSLKEARERVASGYYSSPESAVCHIKLPIPEEQMAGVEQHI